MSHVIRRESENHYVWGAGCDGWHFLNSPLLSVIAEKVPPYCSERRHFHKKAQQFFFILNGSARFLLGEESYSLSSGEGIHVPEGISHAITNDTDSFLEFLVISQPHAHGDRVDEEINER